LTRPERFAKKRGKFIIRISLGILIFLFNSCFIFAYLISKDFKIEHEC
jgi:hypothetical protein